MVQMPYNPLAVAIYGPDGKPIPPGSGATDSAGNVFDPDSLPQTLAYDDNGNVETVTVTDGTSTWVQTLTWEADPVNGGYRCTNVSAWVKQ